MSEPLLASGDAVACVVVRLDLRPVVPTPARGKSGYLQAFGVVGHALAGRYIDALLASPRVFVACLISSVLAFATFGMLMPGPRSRDWKQVLGETLSAFEAVVTEAVAGGDKVQLPGFLTFDRAERAARTGRNPATGKEISIPAATVPRVKAGKSFKDAVGG